MTEFLSDCNGQLLTVWAIHQFPFRQTNNKHIGEGCLRKFKRKKAASLVDESFG
jgi:hypothetical protein